MNRIFFFFIANLYSTQAFSAALSSDYVIPEITSAQYLKTFLMLALVLAILFLGAFLLKKIQPKLSVSNGLMSVQAMLPLGQKERVVLVQVGGKSLLLGHTQENISVLHIFDEDLKKTFAKENLSTLNHKKSFKKTIDAILQQRTGS